MLTENGGAPAATSGKRAAEPLAGEAAKRRRSDGPAAAFDELVGVPVVGHGVECTNMSTEVACHSVPELVGRPKAHCAAGPRCPPACLPRRGQLSQGGCQLSEGRDGFEFEVEDPRRLRWVLPRCYCPAALRQPPRPRLSPPVAFAAWLSRLLCFPRDPAWPPPPCLQPAAGAEAHAQQPAAGRLPGGAAGAAGGAGGPARRAAPDGRDWGAPAPARGRRPESRGCCWPRVSDAFCWA